MKRSSVVLSIGLVAVIVVSFFVERAQADGLQPSSATTSVERSLVSNSAQLPLNKIVYSSGYTTANQTYNIYVMNADGSGQTQLTNQTGSRYLKPTWSPDGTQIAFSIITPITGDTINQVWLMNANGSNMHNLVDLPGHHFHPTWSPDGTRIAFSSDLYNPGATTPNHIYVIKADGSGPPVNLTSSATAHDTWPDWSPDGARIAYVSGTGADFANTQIYVVNANGTGQTNISNSAYADYAPSWSPDGRKIAFYRNLGTADSPNRQIFVMNADGTGQTQLTNNAGQNFYPNWSPDGTRIAFQTYFTNTYADIYIMNADGSGVTNITNHQASYASVQPNWYKPHYRIYLPTILR